MTALIDSLSASENLKNTGTIMDFEEYGDTDVSGSEPQRVVIDDVVPEVIEEEEEVKNTNIIKIRLISPLFDQNTAISLPAKKIIS